MNEVRPNIAPGVRAAPWLHQLEWIVVVLSSAGFLFPSPTKIFAIALVPLWWGVREMLGLRNPLRTPFDGALCWIVMMAGVSSIATADLTYSLPKITGLLFGVLCYLCVVRAIGGRKDKYVIFQTFFALGGGLFSIIALIGTKWTYKIPAVYELSLRLPKVIRGLAGAEDGFHPNGVGGVLVFFIPVQIAAFHGMLSRTAPIANFALRWALGVLGLVVLLVTVGTLVLTQSRGAWLGLAVGAGLVALIVKPRYLAFGLGAAALTALTVWFAVPSKFERLASSASIARIEQSVAGRMELWPQALSQIKSRPITGVGMNMFRRTVSVIDPATGVPFDVAHAHNHLLQVGLDLGLPGLSAYLALWISAAWLLTLIYRASREPWSRSAALCLSCGLTAHFVFGLADAIALGAKVGIFFWLMLALVAALFLTICTPQDEPALRQAG